MIFGADSHTCSYGALGAFGTGVGCTDFLYGMVTGTSWVMVPETVKFNLTGKLPEGVYARDLILTIIGEIGANGCNYQAMEFTGEGARTLSISDRMALCNMAVEAGAKTGIFEADDKALEYLKEHGREPKAVYHSDPDAVYAREYTFDLSKVRPVVAKPDFVDNVVPAEETCGIKINEAFLGSCNNGRIEDLRVGAEVIKGKKVAEGVRFLVVPASQTIYRQALKEGLIDIFMEAGAIVMNPNCSVCWGSCQGVIGENEVLISTGTRNFRDVQGIRAPRFTWDLRQQLLHLPLQVRSQLLTEYKSFRKDLNNIFRNYQRMIRFDVGSYNRADRKHLPDDTERNKQEIYIWKHLQEKCGYLVMILIRISLSRRSTLH